MWVYGEKIIWLSCGYALSQFRRLPVERVGWVQAGYGCPRSAMSWRSPATAAALWKVPHQRKSVNFRFMVTAAYGVISACSSRSSSVSIHSAQPGSGKPGHPDSRAASWRCPQTILLNHHFIPSSCPVIALPSAHCACGNFILLFSVASASFRFIIKIWLAANSGSFLIYATIPASHLQLPVKR